MIEVLFEDNHLLVLNKPAGIPTQPAKEHENSLETMAKEWVKEKYKKPGAVYLHAIHRLDTPVSGIVVFAKTSKALSRLQALMRQKEIRKTYMGWVEGALSEEGSFEDYLIHGEGKALIGKKNDPEAKFSLLSYQIVETKKNRTLVQVNLETGRYHQIRIQFASRGHPIIGDRKYGSLSLYPSDKIALHHTKLEIKHPVKEELLVLKSQPVFQNLD